MRLSLLSLILWATLLVLVIGWTKEDHEIFRLRDEVLGHEGPDVTFYDFLGVSPRASLEEINKAYRKRSKVLHPDKAKQSLIAAKAKATPPPKSSKKKPGVHVNKGPSESELNAAEKKASVRYARLGVVANILRGPERERYDHFLSNGFPKWRGTGYYYARFRPGLGSVLVGLFVFGGGLVHYGALYLSWKRQRDFVERYIRLARRTAWGDESGIKGIPGLDGPVQAIPSPSTNDSPEDGAAGPQNRRQRRLQERENKKESKKPSKSSRSSGTSTPLATTTSATPATPQGEKKRVQAENGKLLLVDAVGNVFIEEESEDGEKAEYLLDPNEIPQPTIRQTVLFRLPVWAYRSVKSRLTGHKAEEEESDKPELERENSDTEEEETDNPLPAKPPANGHSNSNSNNAAARRRAKHTAKAR
ncbi:hypothetical protein MMC20_002892 [Loxospora ochrophaea]|nr:hypothetical protein [Loxospora ochrophaea]